LFLRACIERFYHKEQDRFKVFFRCKTKEGFKFVIIDIQNNFKGTLDIGTVISIHQPTKIS